MGDVVDGIVEDPQADYEQQLVELAAHGVLVDPPLPDALVLVKVPFLGLLGITDEPAELVGPQSGPVPEDVARKLLKNCSSFLRVLTDPITGRRCRWSRNAIFCGRRNERSCRALLGVVMYRIVLIRCWIRNWIIYGLLNLVGPR
ncbi:hypothetical protein NHF46_17505 [Arthrobacter alpinus]|nr:hypothetical protein [Arthrobacter alpinus]